MTASPRCPALPSAAAKPQGGPWWRSAVIYQVYLRSFADGNGDGLGDIAGLRSRLDYLVALGVDGVWVNPWYPSPMADAGYDVADYRDVDPRFGSLADAEDLVAASHRAGLRVLLDIVPNHTSDAHPWFREALAAGPGAPARARYLFRPGRGAGGTQPPNDWRSVFGGPAWTRVREPDGRPGEWYLHLFAPQQPDLDWTHPEVRAEFLDTLRFWFDRGVDGFRIDVAHALAKDPALRDLAHGSSDDSPTRAGGRHPHWDRDEVHAIYRQWRQLADSYDPPRVFVAEAWVASADRLTRYLRPNELHTAFNFDFLRCPWRAPDLREVIDATMATHARVGAPPTWVLSNHDVTRHPSRYARPQEAVHGQDLSDLHGLPTDAARGLRRARASILLMLALPGSAYLYQGEELGLPEVEDLPEEVLADPVWERSGHTRRGRDGCRVPLPWHGSEPPFGFSPPEATAPTWLPQPSSFRAHTVATLRATPGSIWQLYHSALLLRRSHPALGDGPLSWHDSATGTLFFRRPPGFACLVNLAPEPVELPGHAQVLIASDELAGRQVPEDTAVWLALA